MNIHRIGGAEPPAKDPRVSRTRGGIAKDGTPTSKARGSDTVSLDRESLERVNELKTRIIDSPEVRRERIEQLREEFQEGRLRQQAVFEATAEAILKGNSVIDDIDLSELI